MKTYVLFHAGCADGFCAAWVARSGFALGRVGSPAPEEAEYLVVNYGQPVPDIAAGSDVYVLDFSWKLPEMVALALKAGRLFVLDHHQTAEAELKPLASECVRLGKAAPSVWFNMDKSGARLAWEWFRSGEPSPWLVDYVEDRDLWRWRLTASREISACIASHPFDFGLWDYWGSLDRGEAICMFATEGRAILRYQQQQVESACKKAAEIELAGHKVLATNTTHLASEIAGKLAEGRPFGAVYFVREDGKRVWSLRSAPDGIDVSEVAKSFGGGGHKHAAGFTEGGAA